MVVLERHDQLDLDAYLRVAVHHEPVAVGRPLSDTVAAGRDALLTHLTDGRSAYGVNTGLGYLADRAVDGDEHEAFQRSILVGRAAATGPPLSEAVIRGTMLLRLTGFLSGRAGVSEQLCAFIADRLNDGWSPIVPAAVTGAAGETVPLAHLFQTFVGEGLVRDGGETVSAADALGRRGISPYELGAKEGLALINGAPLAPTLGVALMLRAEALVEHATLAGALAITVTSASARPFSARVGALKGDPGQSRVHARLSELLPGAALIPERLPAPVSLRVIPQVHGSALDLLAALGAQIDRELRAVTDSPVLLPASGAEPEGLYPTGNFHSQALTLLLDAVTIACTQVFNLVEKRLHRLLDRRFSGLPDQLARDPGRQSGVVALHKQVAGLSAEARTLAAPAAVHAVDTSAGQEDFQAHTMLAALQLERVLTGLQLALAYEFVALRQALDLAAVPLAGEMAAVGAALSDAVPPLDGDRALAADVERVADLVASGRLAPSAPRWFPIVDGTGRG
jgi:histidine ammonia-lyase